MTTNDKLIERVARRMLTDMEDHGGVDDFCDKMLGFPEQYLSELAAGAVDELSGNYGALAPTTARDDALEEAAKVAEASSFWSDSVDRALGDPPPGKQIATAIRAMKGSKP